MALTPNLTTVTVAGTYVNLQGTPIAGQVKFTPRSVLIDSAYDQIIIPNTITVTLDATGSFAVALPATDDPDITPTGFTYRVEESFSGGRTYDISIPSASAGGSINLADVVPALESSGAGAQYVSLTQYAGLSAQLNSITAVTSVAQTAAATVASASAAATAAASAAATASATATAYAANYMHPFLLMGV